MAQSQYFQINPIRRQQNTTSDVNRGMNVGSEIGKLLGGLSTAIQGAQKDALANKLMNTENAPRAALVSPGGTYQDTGGPQPTQGGGGDTVDPNADLSTDLPEDVSSKLSVTAPPQTFPNPATGNIEPLQGQAPVTYSGTNTDPVVAQQVAQAKTAATLPAGQPYSLTPQPGMNFVPNAPVSSNVNTAGTPKFTGGVEGMKLQQEFQKSQMADQLQKLQIAAAQRTAAEAQTNAPINAAMKRAQLAAAQMKLANPKTAAATKEGPPVDISGEPVTSQTQLTSYIDGLHGKGTMAAINSMVASGTAQDANGNPINLYPGTDNKGNPLTVPDNIPVQLSKNKTVNIPLPAIQNYTKQQNALLFKQNQPLLKVPGEDQSVGSAPNNPYQINNKVDMFSRPHGSWVRLPNRKIAQVP